jgi:hypothetical protein
MTTNTFTVPAGDFFHATLEFVDAFGNIGEAPAGIVPLWSTANAQMMTITPAADGLSANCVSLGAQGNVDISVIDSEVGANLTGDLVVTITAGPVAQLSVVPGPLNV